MRIKYLQQIARHDANLIKIIENKRQQIAAIKRTLQSNLQQKNLALREIQKRLINTWPERLKNKTFYGN